MTQDSSRKFVTLGMFIIDELVYDAGRITREQIGGGGTYATIGARIWLPPHEVGMIVDRGYDFPLDIQTKLEKYGTDMWYFHDDQSRVTTRARNTYIGDSRGFEYLTPRRRITPRDLEGTTLARPVILHFICSPTRANAIMSEVLEIPEWTPKAIYEPIPDRCVPEELPSLIKVLPRIDILSPNADEALSLLSLTGPATQEQVEAAADRFLELGVGPEGNGYVIIRSGALGAYVASRTRPGRWFDAYWTKDDAPHIVDVTGAGNAFLGGLAAGLHFTDGDPYEAMLYASVSASFIIEQEGLPSLAVSEVTQSETRPGELWNGELPVERLEKLRKRIQQ
ncbi:hypothetical protein QCA50_000283 [Cerrena zonata]|uniref:Carbohydrate kinase PfkB domain-containing protein n=1 Tax=Cerrena zonata TaxID=2478898 RepID=A0AAW0GSM2_9APHY